MVSQDEAASGSGGVLGGLLDIFGAAKGEGHTLLLPPHCWVLTAAVTIDSLTFDSLTVGSEAEADGAKPWYNMSFKLDGAHD